MEIKQYDEKISTISQIHTEEKVICFFPVLLCIIINIKYWILHPQIKELEQLKVSHKKELLKSMEYNDKTRKEVDEIRGENKNKVSIKYL